MGRDEVLKYVQTFTEVRHDRRFNDRAIRLGHQATHTRQLANLCRRTTGTGVGHDEDTVEGVLLDFIAVTINNRLFRDADHHRLGDFIIRLGPDIDDLVVLLACGYQARGELVFDLFDFCFSGINDLGLGIGDNEVVNTDRGTGPGRQTEAGVHQLVSEDNRGLEARTTIHLVDQAGDRLLLHRLIDQRERYAFRQNAEQQRTTDGGVVKTAVLGALASLFVDVHFVQTHLDAGMQRHGLCAEGALYLIEVGEHHAFTLGVDLFTGHVVQTQNNVLRRYDDRLAVGRRQHVVGRHHQRTGFELCFQGQRYVDRHLVTVKVGVVSRTHQRVQLDRLTFDQQWLKRLDAQTVQRRRAVKQYRVFADNVGQDVPHFRQLALNHLFRGFNRGCMAQRLQLGVDERLEQLKRHFLRQTTLVQTQGRAHGNDRTA